jgi:hypothetical protein
MAKKKDAFLEGLKRRQQQAGRSQPVSTSTTEKPIEQMTGEELDEALTAAQRELLDARHAELRERELARIQGTGSGTGVPSPTSGTSSLADMLREKQRGKRRTWR